MNISAKYFSIGATIAAALTIVVGAVLFGFIPSSAFANPLSFSRTQTATATTSPVYMTAGTATTTLTHDFGTGNNFSGDSASLLVQLAGSSTATVLNIDVEYSQDGADWYATSIGWNADVGVSTTSPALGPLQQIAFQFASSTINRSVVTNANSATSTRIVKIPTPTRFVRAILTLATGSTRGAVWAEFIGKKQNQ